MSEILSQRVLPQGNLILPNTNLYIHAVGCFVVEIAQAVGESVQDTINKLHAVGGFNENGEVIWAKIADAFPGFTATLITPYNNEAVLQNLHDGHTVLVEVSAAPIGGNGLHCVTYIGGEKCLDPWTGTERPTSDFPDVKAFVVITKPVVQTAQAEPTPPPTPEPATPEGNYYQGLDLTNEASVKAAIDTWKAVEEGQYVTADEYTRFANTVCNHLGIDTASDLNKITQSITSLKEDFAKAVQTQTIPAPAQTEAVAPVAPAPVTAQALPQDQKESLLQHVEQSLKSFLGL